MGSMGMGINGGGGFYWDVTMRKYGIYNSFGASFGIDESAGGVAGAIYGSDAFDKFKGLSWTSNVGFLFFTFTNIYSMDNEWIGNAVGIDLGPLPASATLDFSNTTSISSSELKNKLKRKLTDIYNTIKWHF